MKKKNFFLPISFLEEVLSLQQSIEQIGQDESKGLENICFAPMTLAGETPKLEDCVIQSVLGYFKNSLDRLRSTSEEGQYTINYLNHLSDCFS